MTTKVLLLSILALFLAIPSGSVAGEGDALERGVSLFEAGDLPGARVAFEEQLQMDADNHEALFYLGRISLADDSLDDAIDQLKKAVKLDADDSIYRTWLGRAYIAKLQTSSFFEKGVLSGRALENLQKAVKLDPTNVEARVTLGGYYLNAPGIAGGSKKKAREQAEEVLKLDPGRGNAMMVNIYIKDEEYDKAIAGLEECIQAEPEDIDYLYQLGMIYQSLERYDESFEVFERVLEIDPDAPGAIYQIGRTAALSGQKCDRGIECLARYLEIDTPPGYPGPDGAHWRMGMIFEHRGDTARARSEYETAVRLNPDEDRYQDSLKMLEQD